MQIRVLKKDQMIQRYNKGAFILPSLGGGRRRATVLRELNQCQLFFCRRLLKQNDERYERTCSSKRHWHQHYSRCCRLPFSLILTAQLIHEWSFFIAWTLILNAASPGVAEGASGTVLTFLLDGPSSRITGAGCALASVPVVGVCLEPRAVRQDIKRPAKPRTNDMLGSSTGVLRRRSCSAADAFVTLSSLIREPVRGSTLSSVSSSASESLSCKSKRMDHGYLDSSVQDYDYFTNMVINIDRGLSLKHLFHAPVCKRTGRLMA